MTKTAKPKHVQVAVELRKLQPAKPPATNVTKIKQAVNPSGGAAVPGKGPKGAA